MQCRLSAETVGTFWRVFGGCASAGFAPGVPDPGIGFVGVGGLRIARADHGHAVRGIPGKYFKPVLSPGLKLAGRFERGLLLPYRGAQAVGAVEAALFVYAIASGQTGFTGVGGFASTEYGAASPGRYSMVVGCWPIWR